jgi:hypothetical protein
VATTQSLSKPEANDFVGFRGRIESLSARSLRELSDTASVRDDAGNVHIRKTLIILLSAFFTIGLLLGWIVIGWWLWPVEWSTFTPQDTASDYQQMLVTWGANKYWDTGDATQVRKAFGAWDRDDLAKLLSGMQRNTKDTEMRRRLVALTQALDLPVSDSSLLGFVAQPGIVVGILLSAAPLLGALGFVTLPRLRRKRAAELEEMVIGQVVPAEESLDELLADVDVNDPAAVVVPGEEKEEEKEDEKPSDEEAEGQSSGLGDLASLFEEEETSISALEAFCKGMPEISVEELITMGANILQRMRQSKPEDRRN